jgi:lysophospholipase L1-like esterase
LIFALLALTALLHPTAATASGCPGKRWISAWGASPTDASRFAPDVAGRTTRVDFTPTISGQKVKVVLTGRFSSGPITVTDAFLGVQREGASLVPGTNRRLTFSGMPSVTIQPGRKVASDPLKFNLERFRPVAVSAAVSQSSTAKPTTDALEPSYRATGNLAAVDDGAEFSTVVGRPLLAAVQVVAARNAGTVVAFGDSITDGPFSGGPGYAEFLARRLAQAQVPQLLSVFNAGISGNRLLVTARYGPAGVSGLTRFDTDVLAQAGVTDAIILIGINDIGHGAEPPELIAGLTDLVDRMRAAGVRAFLGTLTPSGGSNNPLYTDADALEDRATLNAWIRGQSSAAVVDFDRALADPADPNRLLPAYDSGDHLHPSEAGHERMAREVDLAGFQGGVCGG